MVNSTTCVERKYAAETSKESLTDVLELASIYGNFRWKPGREARCCAFSQVDNKFAWSTGHGYIKIVYDISFNLSKNVENHGDHCRNRILHCCCNVMSMEFAPSFKLTQYAVKSTSLLAVGLENGEIKIWNSDTGELVFDLSDHKESVKGLTFSSCNLPLLVSCSMDKTLKVWDLEDDGNMTLTIHGHNHPVLDCAYSPSNSGIMASVGMFKSVIIWKFMHKRSCKLVHRLRGHNNDVVSCSWTPDGALLATASHDSTVIVWDPHATSQVFVLCHLYPMPCPIYAGGANGAWVTSVCFSNDGSKIATVCEDNHVRVWKLWSRSDAVFHTLLPGNGFQCRFSPSGSILAVGKKNGSVTLANVCDKQVLSLKHLSRTAARTIVSSTMIDLLYLPQPIKDYLAYRSSLD